MSEDRPGTGAPGDGLSEEQVAQLLAAAGAAEPTPPDVAARLDSVLADLVAEREPARAASTEARGTEAPAPGRHRSWPCPSGAGAGPGHRGCSWRLRSWDSSGSASAWPTTSAGGSASTESATAGDAAGSASEESATPAPRAPAGRGSGRRRRTASRTGTPCGTTCRPPRRPPEAMRLPEVLRITDTASLRAAVRATGAVAGDPGA